MQEPAETRHAEALARLQAYIRDGKYGRGDRIPPERQLMEQLGMSRATLRQALEALERSGAIWRHVGKGTFVGDGPAGLTVGDDSLADLGRQLTPMRMMHARLCLEPALAREAAVHATGEAMTAISRTTKRARAAATWAEYETQDDHFHRAIAQASDNVLLLSFFDQLNRARRVVTWGTVERRNVKPPEDHSSFEEHDAIVQAIADRDGDRAWSAMRDHLKLVSTRLFP
ncbi:FadR/GntR family transcriptional regulator [Tropicimonas sp. TH_r6]|uniref:FadR/GntR family transcriptional regulator n=1 Tax=Tropicimonas sp. TH_r6 TaxID=3082085 RepID=UPI002954280B|nr:FadR/GntR family transcriptional regulator [Tropicimonas sp. TH_r6]MDV7143456.1 FadR/GntR family transcriptional regulator [Tropicimonas sp. TH_r6]